MTQQAKMSVALAGTFLVVVATLLTLTAMTSNPDTGSIESGESRLVRSDSHVIGPKGSSEVTFVEFLDFECEGCLAAYPAIEQLREDYKGRVTFVVRHFPLHFNSERAARAAEASAQQGQFEQMYQRLFETAEQWGHQQQPADDVFASFADDLGLDVSQFKADYEDSATAKRVARDVDDGKALGVQGTPTFFVDGEKLEPQSYDDLTEALDAALAD